MKNDTGEDELLEAMRKLAVRSQNTLVNVVKFLDLVQDQDESAGSFVARLKGQANICNFSVKCTSITCGLNISYTDQMVTHQLVRGLSDQSIQEQTLAHSADVDKLDLTKTLKFVEAKEAGKRSSNILTETAGLNRISEFQKQKMVNKIGPAPIDNRKCGWCGLSGHGGCPNRQTRKEKCKAFNHTCENCSAIGHYSTSCKKKKSLDRQLSTLTDRDESESQLSSFCNLNSNKGGSRIKKTLPHTAYDSFRGWIAARPQGHPCLKVTAAVCTEGYEQLGLTAPKAQGKEIDTASLPDTGAQLTVAGMKQMHQLGIKRHELIPLSHGVSVANNKGLGLLGGALIEFYGKDKNGEIRRSKQLCYIAKDIDHLYLSRTACAELGLIGDSFPSIGDFSNLSVKSSKNKDVKLYDLDYASEIMSDNCTCPKRQLPPPVPIKLPFPATAENREKLKAWILETYAASAFNQCEHQPLPLMKGSPPIKLHIDGEAKPVAIHKARPVPIHWRDQVKKELDRDKWGSSPGPWICRPSTKWQYARPTQQRLHSTRHWQSQNRQ